MLGSPARVAIRTIAVLVDAVPEAVLCSGMHRRVSVVAVSRLEAAELLVGVGPGAQPEVFVRHIPIPIQIVVVVALAVGVDAIVRGIGCTWVHAGIAVVAVDFVGPGVAIVIHAMVETQVAGIGPSLCTCCRRKPDR